MQKRPFEPYRIKAVDPIHFTTKEERIKALAAAGYNVFLLRSRDVQIDLLTDSGTGALSANQLAALMQGDESYAGSDSFERFRSVISDLTGLKHILPTHQGRAAERILFQAMVQPGDVVPNNTHFDTTRANIEYLGAEARDLVIGEAHDSSSTFRFKGNIDLALLERTLMMESDRIPLVMLTITNNSVGGQPVSLENIRAVRSLCDRFNKPLFLDACRFAENAWFVKQHEPGQSGRSVQEIAEDIFCLADGCTMSAKKDGLAHIGGFLALDDDRVAAKARSLLVLTEGFPTYGGLAGRDLEVIATGLEEVVDETYLADRIDTIANLAYTLSHAGVPVVLPPGGHAVYIDAGKLMPQIPREEFPGIALANELYLEGGIRTSEIGSAMFGGRCGRELVRLAIPRRLYTRAQLQYVADVVIDVASRAGSARGFTIVEAPEYLRHFQAKYAPAHATIPSGRSECRQAGVIEV